MTVDVNWCEKPAGVDYVYNVHTRICNIECACEMFVAMICRTDRYQKDC